MVSTAFSDCSDPSAPFLRRWLKPTMAFSRVRSSCESVAEEDVLRVAGFGQAATLPLCDLVEPQIVERRRETMRDVFRRW